MPEYILFNKKTESLELSLPEEHRDKSASILKALADEFGYEPVTPDLVSRMNRFIEQSLG